MKATDIIITTRNRPHYLKETVERILSCTRTPYKLHIIDDASNDETVPYILRLFNAGKLETITLNHKRQGQMNNLMLESKIGVSPIYVHVDDDVLCPDIEPDWLSRGLDIIGEHDDIGMMALNHPGARRVNIEDRHNLMVCRVIGGTYSFIRRKCSRQMGKIHRYDLGTAPQMTMCRWARHLGYQVGYAKKTYCYHIGDYSILTEGEYKGVPSTSPLNWETLEPKTG
jgi:glycosyltransferase involved in cell wall biosynthesis